MDKMEVKPQVHGQESWRDARSSFFLSKPCIGKKTSLEIVKQKTTVDGSDILDSPVARLVVYSIIYQGFYTSQLVC